MLSITEFKRIIYTYYAQNKRNFLWRDNPNPYYIVVSEIMLQQTQTFRVEPKFANFVQQFSSFDALAQAPFAHVLLCWSGLGYNRRALYLHTTAQKIITEHNGQVPCDPIMLEKLPGIGSATARSIVTFAYNKPEVFIETNIRAVFLHHFYPGIGDVSDKDLYPLVQETVDTQNPREWYYALMDYGVMLKKNYKNPSRRSKHYAVQSKFEGSDRQIRGKILRELIIHGPTSLAELCELIPCDYDRMIKIVDSLCADKIVKNSNINIIQISN